MTRNRILAAVALVLGAIAILGNPYRGSVVTLNTKELATIVEAKVDHVTAAELADWIIQGDTEYRLIDIREPGPFAEYHIPTAENVSIVGLSDYPLLRNERIVLYSQGGIHSAQAWMLLKARGYRGVYMILGGLDAWMDEVLFPSLAPDASPQEQARFERARFVSEFFGGTPRTGVEAEMEQATVPLPTVEAPARTVVPTRKKKKKEGC
jgi:rhodanese-related sulfurtransferase